MKNIIREISKFQIILWILIVIYIVYFSFFTILRYKTLYASYYDLGIMNQAVYNTYMAIKKHDFTRILEITDPGSSSQIKRMAVHNDILLAAFAPFYFINAGPETLLIIQTIILALGAWAVFQIGKTVLKKNKYVDWLSLIFVIAYLFYTSMQRANIFDFHAVTISTSLLLFMFYFWLVKKYWLSFIFLILSLFSKEQVGLTTALFGIYTLFSGNRNKTFSFLAILISLGWFILSVWYIIPLFRGHHSFALQYYGDFGDSPAKIITGIIKNPYSVTKYIFRNDTLRYFWFLLGPLGFLSFLSPVHLGIAAPEFAINLLSNNWNMRNIIFQYTSVIQPFVFISAIYGAKHFISTDKKAKLVILMIFILTLIFSYFKSPLPYSREKDIYPLKYPQKSAPEIEFWQKTLSDDSLKISATGQVAPHFSNHRYLYLFDNRYKYSDYVVIRLTEIYNYPEKNILIPIYEKSLKQDKNFSLIYHSQRVEVYKKI